MIQRLALAAIAVLAVCPPGSARAVGRAEPDGRKPRSRRRRPLQPAPAPAPVVRRSSSDRRAAGRDVLRPALPRSRHLEGAPRHRLRRDERGVRAQARRHVAGRGAARGRRALRHVRPLARAPDKLPSIGEFRAAFRAFRVATPTCVSMPRRTRSTTSASRPRPSRAGRRVLQRREGRVRRLPRGRGRRARPAGHRSCLRRYRRHVDGDPQAWGLHNYADSNRFRSSGLQAMLNAVPGEIWLTETGGLVQLAERLERDEQRAARASRSRCGWRAHIRGSGGCTSTTGRARTRRPASTRASSHRTAPRARPTTSCAPQSRQRGGFSADIQQGCPRIR